MPNLIARILALFHRPAKPLIWKGMGDDRPRFHSIVVEATPPERIFRHPSSIIRGDVV